MFRPLQVGLLFSQGPPLRRRRARTNNQCTGDLSFAWFFGSTVTTTSDPGSAVPSGGQPGGGTNPLRTPAEKGFRPSERLWRVGRGRGRACNDAVMEDDSRPPGVVLEPLVAMGDLVPSDKEVNRVEGILNGLAQVALGVVRGAEAASLTLVGAGGAWTTPAFTEALAERMDTMQYAVGQGPCLEAATAVQWTAVLVRDLQDETRWPALAAQGAAAGVRSVMSVSLFAGPSLGRGGGQQAVGSLNLYASRAAAFGQSERDTALLLALYAALALAATEAIGEAGEQVDQLKEAMATRNVIGQAQGILMERNKFTAGQAFDRLRTASMNLNRKLRDVAKDLAETGEEVLLTPPQRLSSTESARIRAVARYNILVTNGCPAVRSSDFALETR